MTMGKTRRTENPHGNGDEKNVVSVAVCGDGDGEFFSLRGRGWGGIPWRGILHCQHMAVQLYLTLGDRDSKLPVDIDDDECVGDGRPHIEKFYYLFLRTSWIFPHAEDAAACRGPSRTWLYRTIRQTRQTVQWHRTVQWYTPDYSAWAM